MGIAFATLPQQAAVRMVEVFAKRENEAWVTPRQV
jgi:hypothetical protein